MVFDAFVEPEAQKFLYGNPEEPAWTVESELDLCVGGTWTIAFGKSGEEPYRETNVFTEVDRPRRIVFDLIMAMGAEGRDRGGQDFGTNVTVTFEERDGKTLLTIVETGFERKDDRDGAVEGGWADHPRRARARRGGAAIHLTRKETAMRKVIINEQLSLDGVMQGPGGPEEDTSGGFQHGGWAMPYFDESMGKAAAEGMGSGGGILLGRKTYEIFAGYWPHQGDDVPFASFLNTVPKYVASRTLQEPLEWKNSQLLKGDVAEAVRKLKQEDGGDIVVLGSGELAQTLMEHGLIDVYDLWVDPIVLGTGKRLFREGPKIPLKLVKSEISTTGVAMLTYEPGDA